MKSNIFIPKKINVGFQNRSDTYTKKLAYIIYYDQNDKLRKEASWKSWRDEEIDNIIHENVPTEGFVLNKKAGGYSTGWNHRQTYVRVYDPRGYEFEITIANLLYILENTNSIKGKGLEGEFIYGWDKSDLILIPTGSPDYKEITEFNEIMHNKTHLTGKQLKLGGTYLTKDNKKLIYLGKYDEYGYDREKKKGKSFYFYDPDARYYKFEIRRSLGQHIIGVESEECVENYADLIDELERNSSYSPIDASKDEYVEYTKNELEEAFNDRRYKYTYIDGKNIEIVKTNEGTYYYRVENPNRKNVGWGMRNDDPFYLKFEYENISKLIEELKPTYLRKYLANGNLYSEGK